MTIRGTFLYRSITLIPLLILIAALTSCTDRTESRQKVRIASVPAIVEAPTHIAYHNGYFKQEGLAVDLSINPDGKTSLNQLLNGEVDIAAVTGTPVVYSSLKGNKFVIFGNVDHSKIHFVVARKDRGIKSIADLKSRKVAVMLGTSGQFFMDSLLTLNHLAPEDLEIINMNAPAQVDAFINGDVDAIFCWVPFPFQALQALGITQLSCPVISSDPDHGFSSQPKTTSTKIHRSPRKSSKACFLPRNSSLRIEKRRLLFIRK